MCDLRYAENDDCKCVLGAFVFGSVPNVCWKQSIENVIIFQQYVEHIQLSHM